MFKNSQWDDAIKLYTECLEIEPDHKVFNSKILCNRAAALQKLRRNAEALSDCNQAIAYDANYTKAYLRRAQCFFDLGGEQNLEYCIRDYERIIGKYERNGAYVLFLLDLFVSNTHTHTHTDLEIFNKDFIEQR